MRILFTGHSGYLGKELIPTLSKSLEVETYQNNLLDNRNLNNFIKSKKIERIVHAAFKVPKPAQTLSNEAFLENIEISKNILELNLPTLMFCSGKIFGSGRAIMNVSEDQWQETIQRDSYGESKYSIRLMGENFPNSKFLRLFNIFGVYENDKRFVKNNLLRYSKKDPLLIYENVFFDSFFAQDLIPIIEFWLKSTSFPKDLNVAYSRKRSLLEYCEIINNLDNFRVPIEFSSESKRSFDYFCDASLLNSFDLDFIGLVEGIRSTYFKIKSKS